MKEIKNASVYESEYQYIIVKDGYIDLSSSKIEPAGSVTVTSHKGKTAEIISIDKPISGVVSEQMLRDANRMAGFPRMWIIDGDLSDVRIDQCMLDIKVKD